MAAELNAVLAVLLWLLVLLAGWVTQRRGALPTPILIVWLAFLSLATRQCP